MIKFIIRRLLIAIVILFGVTIGVFTLVQMQPGNPYLNMISPNLSKEMTEEMLKRLGYYDPIFLKYLKWLFNSFKGDLGFSIRYSGKVSTLIFERLINTALLGSFSFFISSICGIFFGLFLAKNNKKRIDYFSESIFFIALSVPTFFFGIIFIKFLSLNLNIFPSSGMSSLYNDNSGFTHVLDVLYHMFLPALTLGISNFIIITKYTKVNILGVMKKDYMKAARMKGLSEDKALIYHGLKNILLPIITILSLQLPVFLSGSLITETIFMWPGIGRLNYEAIINKDYPIVMGILLFTAVLILIINLIADILYIVIDKRVKYSSEEIL